MASSLLSGLGNCCLAFLSPQWRQTYLDQGLYLPGTPNRLPGGKCGSFVPRSLPERPDVRNFEVTRAVASQRTRVGAMIFHVLLVAAFTFQVILHRIPVSKPVETALPIRRNLTEAEASLSGDWKCQRPKLGPQP